MKKTKPAPYVFVVTLTGANNSSKNSIQSILANAGVNILKAVNICETNVKI